MKHRGHSKTFIPITLMLILLSSGHAFSEGRYHHKTISDAYRTPDSSPKQDRELTLSDAIAIALENNPDMRVADAETQRMSAHLKRADSAFMPNVDLYTSYQKGDAPSGALFTSIDQRKFDPATDFNYPGDYENFESGITATMPVFNGGRNYLGRKMAAEALSASREGRRSAINRISADVINAWFNTLSAREFINISEESVTTVKSQLDIMMVRYKGGSALKSDILSLKVRLAEAEEDLVRSRNGFRLAKAALAMIMGLPPEKDLTLTDKPIHFEEPSGSLDSTIRKALDSRPEIRQSKAMVQSAGIGMDKAKATYIPSVHLSGKYYYDDPDMNYSNDRKNWIFGVMVNWNIFSGLSGKADRKEALAAMENSLSMDRKTELAIKLDVTRAWLNLEESAARLDVARKSVDMAAESLDLVRKQYEGGSATITRYLEAELALNSSKTRSVSAHYDHLKAIAETARASGVLVMPETLVSRESERENH